MQKLTFINILCLILISCTPKHKAEPIKDIKFDSLSITDNERKGIKDVVDFFGGKCECITRNSSKEVGDKGKYLTLELSKSDFIEKQNDPMQALTTAVYRFHRNLKEEKMYYTNIHVILDYSDNHKTIGNFSITDLDTVDNRMIIVNEVVKLIQDRKYDSLESRFYNTGTTENNKLVSYIKKNESKLGPITGRFELYGFMFNDTIMHLYGKIIRNKFNSDFSIDLDMNEKSDKVHMIKYTFW